ncbi:YcnI family copper-binding membrane protein [Modestobacter roseus]|uniref:Uncharacterized protein YcnI n=1 Tax=Modestobacter roseus TaxID=1181884 RepID=A0A562ILE4_9ACTN|nr:YcnI family protein [Modestobacter roseus]TWH71829.1 uncharacterized protein YcnI [Modestobacter roseus]
MPLSRSARRLGVVVPVALATLLTAGVGAASAHVTVSSADAAPGGYGKLTFRVPNESDTASTVGLRIQIPTDAPLASLRAQPVPGWTVTMTRSEIDPPVEVHGQEVEEAVSVVEFRAEEGQGIDPGEFQEFALSGGPFPDAEQLAFAAVQSYSDGSEAAWIEPTVEGQAEPERPAPVLSLAGEGAAHGAETGTDDAAAVAADDDGGDGLAVTALVLGVLGLLAGLGGLGLGLAARRRTVSS